MMYGVWNVTVENVTGTTKRTESVGRAEAGEVAGFFGPDFPGFKKG
jgi:hypothetical protein